jgi:hypothetical protein
MTARYLAICRRLRLHCWFIGNSMGFFKMEQRTGSGNGKGAAGEPGRTPVPPAGSLSSHRQICLIYPRAGPFGAHRRNRTPKERACPEN